MLFKRMIAVFSVLCGNAVVISKNSDGNATVLKGKNLTIDFVKSSLFITLSQLA